MANTCKVYTFYGCPSFHCNSTVYVCSVSVSRLRFSCFKKPFAVQWNQENKIIKYEIRGMNKPLKNTHWNERTVYYWNTWSEVF